MSEARESELTPDLQDKLDHLPSGPGVYLMKDREGRIVYVGKAVNLRSRVRSYFNRAGDSRAFVPLLEELLGDIETILTPSEKEALILENTLIKKHKPRFNVMLRDDKSFISLRLDKTQGLPQARDRPAPRARARRRARCSTSAPTARPGPSARRCAS